MTMTTTKKQLILEPCRKDAPPKQYFQEKSGTQDISSHFFFFLFYQNKFALYERMTTW